MKTGIKQQKKDTRHEIENKMRSAIVFVQKDRNTISVYFDDKGLRLTVTDDYAIIATGAHQHVFNNITAAGISRPYLYTKRFVEIALENDCTVKDKNDHTTRSYSKLFALLKEKDNKDEYNICWYIDLWLNNIFMPLYSIDETEISSFLVYEQYLHNLAKQQMLLSEHTKDVTNLQFVYDMMETEKEYFNGISETVIIKKKTDDEKVKEEISALEDAMVQQNQDDIINNGK